MKKSLWKVTAVIAGVLLATFAVLLCTGKLGGKSTLGTAHAVEHVDHCECGGVRNGVGDHTCSATTPTWTGVSTESEIFALNGIGSASDSAGEYWIYLKNDITLSRNIGFYESNGHRVTLHLCLNGYQLKGKNNDRVMHNINGVCNITICDCSAGETGTIQCQGAIGDAAGTYQGHAILLHKAGSSLKLYGGTIRDGFCNNNFGGNIVINGSTFKMYGGKILNGTSHKEGLVSTSSSAGYYGGNVALNGASTMYLYAGEISGGTANTGNGGNISIRSTSKLYMYGGTVKDGTAKENYGGNISIAESGAQFIMNGGTVSGGTVTKSSSGSGGMGGNIGVKGTFTMNGGTVTGGFANGNRGGNVSMWDANGQFIMNGGLITAGKDTTGSAGGVAAFYQATKEGNITLNGGEISGNFGGIFSQTGSLKVSGTPTVHNNTGSNIQSSTKSYVTAPLTGGELVFGEQAFVCYSAADYSQYIKCEVSTLNTKYDATEGAHYFVTPFFDGDLANRKVDIYIIAGQSNASGSSSFSSATEAQRDHTVYDHLFFYEKRYDTTGALIRDKSGYGPVHEGLGYDDEQIGPELGMAQVLNSLYADEDKTALFIKTAYGATALTFHQNDEGVLVDYNGSTLSALEDERQTKRGTWYPDQLQSAAVKALGDNRPTGFQLREGIKMVTNVYNELIAKGYKAENITFKSISWMQGETDRAYPQAYKEIFPLTVQEYNAAISALTGKDYSNLRWVIGEICSTFSEASPASCARAGDFIAVQNELPDVVQNSVVIPSKGFPQNKIVSGASVQCGTDNCHWTYADMVEIGQMFAEASLGQAMPSHDHCVCGGSKAGTAGHTCTDENWISLKSAEEFMSLRGVGGTTLTGGTKEYYAYLENDIELYQAVTVSAGVTLHLCLNGHTLTMDGNTECFDVADGAELSVVDCQNQTDVTSDYWYVELPHTHCECGGVRNGVGDHVCTTDTITWTAMSVSTDLSTLPGIGGAALTAGSQVEYWVYLANDVTLAKSMSLVDGVTLHICLNGHMMNGANNSRLFFVNNGAHVTVCDCSEGETGAMKCKGSLGQSSSETYQGHGFCLYSSSTTTGKSESLTWYGGTLQDGTTNYNYGGNIALCNMAEFYMYGGTIKDGKAKKSAADATASGGNIGVNASKGVILMIYAGTVSGGSAGSYGGNISPLNGKCTILGGTITGGKAAWGGNIGCASTTGQDLLIKDAVISNGTATSYAGNIGAYDGTNITLAGTTKVSGGYGSNYGGNIMMKGNTKTPTLKIQDNVIIENGSTGTTSGCYGGNIAISGGAKLVMTSGTVQGGSSYIGGNIAMGNYTVSTGSIQISGGLIQNGQASANGWDIQNETTGSGTITLSGTVTVKNTLSHSVGGSINVGQGVAKITISGGTYDCQKIMATCGEIDITGGYFNVSLNNYTYTYKFAVSGGYFVNAPASTRYVEGYLPKSVTETVGGVTYNYHVVKGCYITSTSRTENAQDPIATTTGGGVLEEGGTVTVTAPASAGGYTFKGWYATYPGTALSTNTSYEVSGFTTDTQLIAVYEYAGTGLALNVAGNGFSVKIGSAAEQSGFGTMNFSVNAGETVVVTYQSYAFLCWKNNAGKVVSKEASYTFTMYTDTDLIAECYTLTNAMTTVVFYNDTNQVIRSTTTDSAFTASDIPEVPFHPGFTGGHWNKTLDEINAGIADADTHLVEVTAVGYEGTSLFEALTAGDEPQIEMTQRIVTDQTDSTKKTLTFGATRSIPEGYTLLEQGFLITSMANASNAAEAKEVLFLDSKKAVKLVSPNKDSDSLTMINIRNVESYATVYAVGYVVYLKDGETEPQTIYTNVNTGKTTGITE